jgi:hypothetical protein
MYWLISGKTIIESFGLQEYPHLLFDNFKFVEKIRKSFIRNFAH